VFALSTQFHHLALKLSIAWPVAAVISTSSWKSWGGGYSVSVLHGAEPFLRSRQLCSYSRTYQHFIEPKSSQEPYTCPYSEPDQSILPLPLYLSSILILSADLCLSLPSERYYSYNFICPLLSLFMLIIFWHHCCASIVHISYHWQTCVIVIVIYFELQLIQYYWLQTNGYRTCQ
jgi:hypothetical protein